MRYEIISGTTIPELQTNVNVFLTANPSFYCVGGVFIDNGIFYQTLYSN